MNLGWWSAFGGMLMKAWIKIIKGAAIFISGLLFGALGYQWLCDSRHLQIDPKVDVSAIVAVGALVASVYLIPFVVDRHLNRQRDYEAIVCGEIEEVISLLNEVDDIYRKIYGNLDKTTIDKVDVIQLRRLITKIQNKIDALSKEYSPQISDFKDSVELPFNRDVRPALTDDFQVGKILEENSYIVATKEIDNIVGALKKKHYQMYR